MLFVCGWNHAERSLTDAPFCAAANSPSATFKAQDRVWRKNRNMEEEFNHLESAVRETVG